MVETTASLPSKRTEKSSLSLIPIGLREASCDSPTFRATAVHFSDQVIVVEKWLNTYIKYVYKLMGDLAKIEESMNNLILRSVPPPSITEAVIDHDYTLLALNRYRENSKNWISQTISCMKRMESQIAEPIKAFINGELRVFKEARRNLDQTQKMFDQMLARYVASLDFCILVPHFRFSIDKLLIRISFDHWRDIKRSSENTVSIFSEIGAEMDRIRGWSKKIELSEAVFRRELHFARREISEIAVETSKPSREIEDYNISTVAFLGSKPSFKSDKKSLEKDKWMAEKQGWLFLRSITGKPARASWARRWFYVKAGIFGWLAQGAYSGAVEESGRIGVLLCNVKPAVQEDRRFCFEIKTKNQAVLLQAETQQNLMEWLEVFERAKKKSLLGNPDTSSLPDSIEFEISAPLSFSSVTKSIDGHLAHTIDELTGHISDRLNYPPISGIDVTSSSKEITSDTNLQRRSNTTRDEDEQGRDQTSRIIQRLDPIRKSGLAYFEQPASSTIGSLNQAGSNMPIRSSFLSSETKKNSLAPTTLALAPASTSLSKKAISTNSERHSQPASDFDSGMSSVIVANFWGSSNWGYIDRLEKGHNSTYSNATNDQDKLHSQDDENYVTKKNIVQESSMKGDQEAVESQTQAILENFPANYPSELMAQDAQFRILFPGVPKSDILLLVFRAIWNHNEQQEFPGRVYVTHRHIYFYSHHLGLVLITGVSMKYISDVTAAPGKDCDFIFLHTREDLKERTSRISLKIFLEPFRLLQSRLSYLIQNSQAEIPDKLEDILSTLVKMEHKLKLKTIPSWDSEEGTFWHTQADNGIEHNQRFQNFRNSIHVERWPTSRIKKNDAENLHLPSQPVNYEPLDIQLKVAERQFNISPKALFHVTFGDNSHIFQNFYYQRGAKNISQGAWLPIEEGRMKREFHFQISRSNLFQTQLISIADHQVIDIKEDYLRYVISYTKKFWHLPYHSKFDLIFKIVITYVAKSKCKLALHTKVDWSEKSVLCKGLIERQALSDSIFLAEQLIEQITEQARKLGPHNRTKKSLLIFGQVGQQSSTIKAHPKNHEPKFKINIKQQTITMLLLQLITSYVQAAINLIFTYLLLAIKLIGSFTSAHGAILSILFFSLLINTFFTLRDTSYWWSERKAINFMTKIGVGPNKIVSKAIYIKDLDDALNLAPVKVSGLNGKKCYNHFKWITNITDLNLPHHLAGTLFLDVTTQSAARRLLRIRQNLGSYRHGILVASRLINSIEKEILRAEWENWLLDENIRCERVSLLLREDLEDMSKIKRNDFLVNTLNMTNNEWHKNKKLDALRKWKEAYCESCAIEQEFLKRGKGHIVFD
ncbi:putative PH domain-containing protein C19A8.02 [Erysiphe neolycopersici]|uniref:Putative PH domain-containing protein C19A8.02 n=1 Tax=Erysiphe neolycopersici TaxID=212602 RepID=A0A420HXQ1_9PEZI|nr:putative PH domain-containing protein C19A8.02 [Erysiphe neolycopersici]